MYARLFLILYIVPLLLLVCIMLLFGKKRKEQLLNAWKWFTVIFLVVLVFVKLVFSVFGILEF